MKLALIFGMTLGLTLIGFAADDGSLVSTPKGKMSYGLGMDIGRNITNSALEVDPEALAAGLKAIVKGTKPALSDEEAKEVMHQLSMQIQAKRMEQQKAMQEKGKEAGAKNKKDGEAFLAENKKKDGVKVLPSGLQYKVLKQGTGKVPTDNDTVIANYRGSLIDKTEFDSSYKRGEPSKFPVKGVIKGWTEALKMMPVGS